MASRPDPGNPWEGMSTGLAISTYLLSALLVWGGVGYAVDWLAGTGELFTAIGMIVGAIAGGYLIHLKYGKADDKRR